MEGEYYQMFTELITPTFTNLPKNKKGTLPNSIHEAKYRHQTENYRQYLLSQYPLTSLSKKHKRKMRYLHI